MSTMQYTIFNIKRNITLNYLKFAAMGLFQRDSKSFCAKLVLESQVGMIKE